MERFRQYLKGDISLWGVILFFALLSFLPVYSSSSNLVYLERTGISTWGYLLRHLVLMSVGVLIIYLIHIFPYQPSAFAMIILLMYVASYLAEIYGQKVSFADSILPLWVPVGITVGLVTLPNFSTGAIMYTMVLMLLFIGRYPIRHILLSFFFTILLAGLFFLFIKAFPDAFPHRADTWKSRIETFFSKDKEENYQSERAKMAIVSGGFWGKGAGKSVMKNLLPQGSSDFIFAIVVEEYGLWGGVSLILLFIIMLVRFVVISLKATSIFGKLLVLGVGIPIVFQGFINMGVSVGLLPVTGQNLPFFTTGGTSIWMTCIALGIVLSVSSKGVKSEE